MPKPGWTTITVSDERFRGIKSIFENDKRRPQNQRFGSWFDNLLHEMIAYEEDLQKYGSFISIETISENHIILSDHITKKHIFVNLNSQAKRLECEQDNASDCIHVGFCLAIPSIYRILVKRGFKDVIPSKDIRKTLGIPRDRSKRVEIYKVEELRQKSHTAS